MSPTPDIPGELVPRNSDHEIWLKTHVARLCGMDHERFPGSQPVSFGTKDLDKLESQDYWVCEKSDGVRVLMLIQTDLDTNAQAVFLIDRHNTYRVQTGLFFPHHENPMMPLRNTILDGELVLDEDPATHQVTLRFLAFDCLVVDDQNVMSRTLDKRYGRLKEWFYKPYSKMIFDHPHVAQSQPFQVAVKDISFSYHVEKVFNVDIPALQHGNDGLIYTCVNTPYVPGTDQNILKWKPPSENSIDFKLVLRFPPMPGHPSESDYSQKPIFGLHVWCGDERGVPRYEPFDVMYVDDLEWEKIKLSGEQIDDRIVEVHWDPAKAHWRMMRFREDKPNGNHRNVVENIIQSIADGVEKDALLARSNNIRNAWKARQGQPPHQPPPQSSSRPPPQSEYPPPQSHYPHPPLPSGGTRLPPAPELTQVPEVEIRYGPISTSKWSKVSGPKMVLGMYR
ncbi:hypothetical protein JAAARDRAFT_172973 [Jaapia argillacea MUCL 33604]|uniref:mRNA-capping enzyme subunit alpha n=1 Tax=Jaapia argillacea MUCL 33604 TaxID=933084 RepID=A0A067QDV4_9AGAM|nr:hypothetical protein JAAARDRAFT_172973 [Jaapia argillacea MUCL 33604]